MPFAGSVHPSPGANQVAEYLAKRRSAKALPIQDLEEDEVLGSGKFMCKFTARGRQHSIILQLFWTFFCMILQYFAPRMALITGDT